MTIYKETEWFFGLCVNRTVAGNGDYDEFIKPFTTTGPNKSIKKGYRRADLFIGDDAIYVDLRTRGKSGNYYLNGPFPQKSYVKEEINKQHIVSRRNLLGFRTVYRYSPSPFPTTESRQIR